MKWIGIALAVLAALILLMFGVGALLPVKHVATRAARFHQPPAVVWAVITRIDLFPSWRPGLKKIERLPDRNGMPAWKEFDSHDQALPLEVTEWTPPARMVTRITNPKLPFGGAWTYEIQSVDGGSALRITENGEVYNPFFRFVSRFVLGYRSAIDAYLKALSQKFGEPVAFED